MPQSLPLISRSGDTSHRANYVNWPGPVVLVGHSYGGSVITEAGDDPCRSCGPGRLHFTFGILRSRIGLILHRFCEQSGCTCSSLRVPLCAKGRHRASKAMELCCAAVFVAGVALGIPIGAALGFLLSGLLEAGRSEFD